MAIRQCDLEGVAECCELRVILRDAGGIEIVKLRLHAGLVIWSGSAARGPVPGGQITRGDVGFGSRAFLAMKARSPPCKSLCTPRVLLPLSVILPEPSGLLKVSG